jgi:hypothetical protein
VWRIVCLRYIVNAWHTRLILDLLNIQKLIHYDILKVRSEESKSVKFVHVWKFVKIRELFPERIIRFIRTEQLCTEALLLKGVLGPTGVWVRQPQGPLSQPKIFRYAGINHGSSGGQFKARMADPGDGGPVPLPGHDNYYRSFPYSFLWFIWNLHRGKDFWITVNSFIKLATYCGTRSEVWNPRWRLPNMTRTRLS